MTHHYLEEDGLGSVIVYDPQGREVERFSGQTALGEALAWANEQGLELRSNRSPIDLLDNQRLYFRRRPRLWRLTRYANTNPLPPDPPNVKRIVVAEHVEFEEIFSDSPIVPPDDIELAPLDEED